MILEATKQLEIETIGDMEQGLTAGISEESMPFVFELVSKQLYSNPIGSVVREITSNCLDAHTEAGNTEDPVIVRYKHELDEGMVIEFQDFGVGISPNRIQEIYMNYFSSTKRGSNAEIGGFGIGSKTPLAYTNMFYITTVFNNMKYELIFHKGSIKPELESLNGWDYHEETKYRWIYDEAGSEKSGRQEPYTHKWKTPAGLPIEEKNGTIIKIPIENIIDRNKFVQEIKFQLAYFDNVYFENWAGMGSSITNNYKIYEGKHFKFRSDIDTSSTNIHLCVGKVRYPIDTTKVRIDNNYTRIPIAVKFDIGELNITPSRESLRYDDKGIKLIEERVKLAGDEIIEKFDTQNPEIEDLATWQKGLNDTPCIWFDREAGHRLHLWSHSGMSKNFKFKPLAGLAIKKTPSNLFFMWEGVAVIKSDGKRRQLSTWGAEKEINNHFVLNSKYIIIKDTDKPSMYTDLKISQNSNREVYLIKKKKLDTKEAFKLLGLKTDENDATTKVLGKAKTVLGYIKKITELVEASSLGYYSEHRAEDAWIAAYKRTIIESSAAWKRKAEQKIFYKTVPRFNGQEDTVASFQNRTGILVYGYKEDRQKLIDIQDAVANNKASYRNIKRSKKFDGYTRQKKAFEVIMIAKSVLEDIVGPKKTIYWEDFIKTGYFKKIYTAYLMQDKFSSLRYENKSLREKFLPAFAEDYSEVETLINKHYRGSYFNNSLLVICEKEVKPIQSMIKVVDSFIAKYDYFIPLIGAISSHGLSARDEASVVWFLKFEKIRLKNQYYLKSKAQLQVEAKERLFKQRLGVIFQVLNQPIIYLLTEKITQNVKDNNNSSTSVSIEETGEDLYSNARGGEILEECNSGGVGNPEEGDRSLQQEAFRNEEEQNCENADTGESSSKEERRTECSSSEGLETTNQERSEERESTEEDLDSYF